MTNQSSDLRFHEIFHTNVGAIEAYARRRLPADHVSDAVSETFLVAWRRLDDVPDGAEARLWLFGIARRIVANLRRSGVRAERLHLKLVQQHGVASQPASPDDASAHQRDRVIDALATLSEDDQELLRLLAWEELSHADISTVLECSVNAVGVRAHRARQRLADALSTESDPR